jgi:hypothetical protein
MDNDVEIDGRTLVTATIVPDPRGITLKVDRVLIASGSTPQDFIGHIDIATGTLFGTMARGKALDHVEVLPGAADYILKMLQIAEANPNGFVRDLKVIMSPPKETGPQPSVGGLLALVLFAWAATGLVPGVLNTSRNGGSGGGYRGGPADDGYQAPSFGGDVHGNPWNGTGSGPPVQGNVHGNDWTNIHGN